MADDEVVEVYPSELKKIKAAFDKIQAEFANTPMNSTNMRLFDMAAATELGEIGFTVEVEWYQVGTESLMTETYVPRIVLTGRNKKETEVDHDRMKWDITHGLADGQAGYIREDGSKREDPIRRDII